MYSWLKDYKNIENEIMMMENSIIRSKRELARWSGGDLGGRILHKDSLASSLEDRIAAKEVDIAHKMNDLFDIKRMVKRFDGIDHIILYGRYIEGKTFDEIADDAGYSKGTIYNKHAALGRVIKYLKEFNVIDE